MPPVAVPDARVRKDDGQGGLPEKRLPHLTNISFGFVEGESLMMATKELAKLRIFHLELPDLIFSEPFSIN